MSPRLLTMFSQYLAAPEVKVVINHWISSLFWDFLATVQNLTTVWGKKIVEVNDAFFRMRQLFVNLMGDFQGYAIAWQRQTLNSMIFLLFFNNYLITGLKIEGFLWWCLLWVYWFHQIKQKKNCESLIKRGVYFNWKTAHYWLSLM